MWKGIPENTTRTQEYNSTLLNASLPDSDSKNIENIVHRGHSISGPCTMQKSRQFLRKQNQLEMQSLSNISFTHIESKKELRTVIASEVSKITDRSAQPSSLKFTIFTGNKKFPNRTAALTEIQQRAGLASDISPIKFNQEMKENAIKNIKEIYKKTCIQPEIFTIQGTSVKPVSSENTTLSYLALPIPKSKHTSTEEEHTKIYGFKPGEKLDYDKIKELPKIQMINLDSNEEFKEHLKNYKLLIEEELSAQLNWVGINCLSDAGHKRTILALYNENNAELYFPLNEDGSATVLKHHRRSGMERLYRWMKS